MTKPDISVIVTLYKRPQYIASLMDSVFAQTLSDWELIFVDDGSDMPELTELCRRYEREDRRIKYVYQENSGVAVARNRGAAEATADYVSFVDDDDLIAPTRLQKQVECLRENPQVMLVQSHTAIVDKHGSPMPRKSPPPTSGTPLVYPPQDSIALVKIESTPGCFCRERFLEVGGFDADFLISEDNEMLLRVLDSHAIAVLPEELYICRRHDHEHLSKHPELWKYVAAGYVAAYHRRSNTPEPAGARPFNLLANLKHMPTDIVSLASRKARASAKRLMREKRYGELAEMLDDFHAAFSFNRKHHRKLHLNLLAWVFLYGAFSALPIAFRSIIK